MQATAADVRFLIHHRRSSLTAEAKNGILAVFSCGKSNVTQPNESSQKCPLFATESQ
jgi:hypothetical protein